MKTTFYAVMILVFSFIVITPKTPKDYPPKPVMEQRRIIEFKERKIKNLINKIEHDLKTDSIQIKIIQYGK